jgi:hypothetical protein
VGSVAELTRLIGRHTLATSHPDGLTD